MSLSKKDQKFPTRLASPDADAERFAAAMAAALQETYGGNGSAIKTVARLTAVKERTVKNWFRGTNGPRGDHLIRLAAHSQGVLDAILVMSGRQDLLAIARSNELRQRLAEILRMLDATLEGVVTPPQH